MKQLGQGLSEPTMVATDEVLLSGFWQKQEQGALIAIDRIGGYSNRNYAITTTDGSRYIARLARLNRTRNSVLAEEHVLTGLAEQSLVNAPVLRQLYKPLPTLACRDGIHYLHLFHHIPGSIPSLWWQQCSIGQLKQMFEKLAALHHAMQPVPALPSCSAGMYRYQVPVQAAPILVTTATGREVLKQWPQFVQAAEKLQQDMAAHFPWHEARYQWIHGDVQLENVLFEEGRFSAFLDFESVSWDACEKDAILSAFRTCKEGNTDAPFQYDKERFAVALDAYRSRNAGLCDTFFQQYDTLWKPFFCLDQAMVYLVNAFDGIWQLDTGIGFLPCFNEVLQYR